MSIAIHTDGLVIEIKELKADKTGSWFSGEAGDSEWNIKDFGMSWGICSTLGDAIRAGKDEIQSLYRDFNLCPYQVENERLNPLYHLPAASEF